MNALPEALRRGTYRGLAEYMIGLLIGLSVTAQGQLSLNSIIPATNGVRLAWTDSEPGRGYTVEVRNSLASGAWRNAPTRYRWPSPFTRWADAPVSLPAANYPGSAFFAIMVASYLPIYHLGGTLEEILAEPYRRTLPPLLDGARGIGQVAAAMPPYVPAIFRPDLQADLRTNVSNPLRQALLRNNVHSWTPRAPVRLVHCRGDDIVTHTNAEVAYQSFTNRGACCVSVVDPGSPARLNHDDCYTPSLREVLTWFETFGP